MLQTDHRTETLEMAAKLARAESAAAEWERLWIALVEAILEMDTAAMTPDQALEAWQLLQSGVSASLAAQRLQGFTHAFFSRETIPAPKEAYDGS